MKNVLGLFLGVLILPLLLWIYQQNYVAAVVTYYVSDAIDVAVEGKTEYGQEIVVSNTGKAAAHAISVKVPKHILTYKLDRHSNAIKEQPISDENGFELVYPELPTGQKFKLNIRYSSSPIQGKWIKVSHSEGAAQEQGSEHGKTDYALLIVVFIFGLLVSQSNDSRKFFINSIIEYSGNEKIFSNSQPWYTYGSNWQKIQYLAIKNWLKEKYGVAITSKSCYLLLEKSMPKLMNIEEWNELIKLATNKLNYILDREISNNKSTEELLDLLKIKKPELLPLADWKKFEENLHNEIFNSFFGRYRRNYDEKILTDILNGKNNNLKMLPENLASQIRESAQSRYISSSLEEAIKGFKPPSEHLKTIRFDLIDEKESKVLKDKLTVLAHLQEFLPNWEIRELEKFAEKGKPFWMTENEYREIVDLVNEFKSVKEEKNSVIKERDELKLKKIELDELIERVKAQLDLIDKVLSKPETIDRLEDYDVTFAKLNRLNLEKVASILKASRI